MDSADERDHFEEEDIEEGNPSDGEKVYEAWFDVTDGIGSGGNYVYLSRGKYYFVTEGHEGEPTDDLEGSIFLGAGEINRCCTWIDCPSIKPEQLVRLLRVHDDSARVEINGEAWAYDEKTGWSGPQRRSPGRQKRRGKPRS